MKGDDEYLKAQQDLLGGIASGVSRGQSLKEAMISLYNAGYEKEEIENAAKAYLELVNEKNQPVVPQVKNSKSGSMPNSQNKLSQGNEKSSSNLPSDEAPQTPQVVSAYAEDKKKEDKKHKFKPDKVKKKDSQTSEVRGRAVTYQQCFCLKLNL